MEPAFTPYDVVRLKNREHTPTAVVTEYSFRWKDSLCVESEIIYTLYMETGQTRIVVEADIERIGRLEPPLQDGEIVEVFPKSPQYEHLRGQLGVIEGFAWDPVTKRWSFGIRVSGEGWAFEEDELKSTGRISEVQFTQKQDS